VNLNKYVKIKKHTFSVFKVKSHLPDSYAINIVKCTSLTLRKTSKYLKHTSGSHSHTRVLWCDQYGCTTKQARLTPVTGNSYTEVRGQCQLSLHKNVMYQSMCRFHVISCATIWLQQCFILVSAVTQHSMWDQPQ